MKRQRRVCDVRGESPGAASGGRHRSPLREKGRYPLHIRARAYCPARRAGEPERVPDSTRDMHICTGRSRLHLISICRRTPIETPIGTTVDRVCRCDSRVRDETLDALERVQARVSRSGGEHAMRYTS